LLKNLLKNMGTGIINLLFSSPPAEKKTGLVSDFYQPEIGDGAAKIC
jgi:hypothetical protein